MQQFWRVLVDVDRVFKQFRSRFLGKASPVHFFWGSFDMAVTRFSGRPAPPHPGGPYVADMVTREAYSHEVSSCGFWPGNGGFGQACLLLLRLPRAGGPSGRAKFAPPPRITAVNSTSSSCLTTPSARPRHPEQAVLEFLESTYAAAADLGHWDRAALER